MKYLIKETCEATPLNTIFYGTATEKQTFYLYVGGYVTDNIEVASRYAYSRLCNVKRALASIQLAHVGIDSNYWKSTYEIIELEEK